MEVYTRYERARIIGARALQISMGAPLLIKTTKIEPLQIAIEEYNQSVIPITVKRKVGVR
ncbi:MAG: DNA-directed RNA polymerase subunit K [Methanobacteriota archaeon]|nr:MAG: DNA-directed RNA polymerase subunit K [Euryarchaeota archaeon]